MFHIFIVLIELFDLCDDQLFIIIVNFFLDEHIVIN